jgi:hypothetical protein
MSVTFMPYVFDATRSCWVRPTAIARDDETFELNVSNANAADLLAELGIAAEPGADPWPIELVAHLITGALRRHLGKRSPARTAITDAAPGRTTIIHCARREGYIEERLGHLAQLVQRSRAIRATHIGWH